MNRELMKRMKIVKYTVTMSAISAFILAFGFIGNNDLELQTETITYIMMVLMVIIAMTGRIYYNILKNRLRLSRRARLRGGLYETDKQIN